jgi:signal transduction histidine kinase
LSKNLVQILVIDDDEVDRKALCRFASEKSLPYRFSYAGSYEDALQMLQDSRFALILLDYDLGDRTGFELLPELAETPVIMVTGGGSEAVAVQALRKGIYDYIVKDHDRHYLQSLEVSIRNVLQRRQAEESLRRGEERYRLLAEFSNTVIHNVGNVLNSIAASCENLNTRWQKSKIDHLGRLSDLVTDHISESAFLREHPKGKQIPEFMVRLYEKLKADREATFDEIQQVERSLNLIREIIQTQQSQGRYQERNETVCLATLIDEALNVRRVALMRAGIRLHVDVETNLKLRLPPFKLTHILVNLIKNAIEAIQANPDSSRNLNINSYRDGEGQVIISIEDSGIGIPEDQLEQVFEHGFTTKPDGHGYGLHYCRTAMRDMGGYIRIESDGRYQGATFKLVFQPQPG